MSLVHLARHGQLLGSFSAEEVQQGIISQRFSQDDLFWKSGMKKWQPLSTRETISKSDASLLGYERKSSPESSVFTEPAWEYRVELGFFKALFQTILQILFSPSKTFSRLKRTGGLGTPFFFYAITNIAVIPLACLNQGQMMKRLSAFIPEFVAKPKFEKILHDAACGITLPKMTAVSLKMIFVLFLTAALLHLSLKIFKNTAVRFETTFRMLCYLGGACAMISILFVLVNFIGNNVGSISTGMKISIYIIGALIESCIGGTLYFIALKNVHHLSSGRTILVALFAGLLPFLTLLALILLLAILIAMFLAAKYFLH